MRQAKTLAVALVAWTVGSLALSPRADARGGQYRGPVGQAPPPSATPPPPPPPPPPRVPPGAVYIPGRGWISTRSANGSSPTPAPGDPTPPPEPTPAPESTPPPSPPPPAPPAGPELPPDSAGGTRRRARPIGPDHWICWWEHARDDVLGLKEAVYRLRITPNSPLAAIGGAGGSLGDATRLTEKEVGRVVVPALERVLAKGAREPDDVVAAALIALGKATSDPRHVRLFADVVHDPARSSLVRESAVLALGLLRRGEGRRAFEVAEIDRARATCFSTFEDARNPTRVRAFAALALGLLGDQPSQETPSARLVGLLRGRYADDDLVVALLQALSLQAPGSVSLEAADVLQACALRGRLFATAASPVVRASAALALGRLGADVHVGPLSLALGERGMPVPVRRSAALALGVLAGRVDAAGRRDAATALARAASTSTDASTRSFAVIGLARLLEADAARERPDAVDPKSSLGAQTLLRIAQDGSGVERPFAALALGLVARAIGERAAVPGDRFHAQATTRLRAGLDDPRLDARSRAAFALGLGLARDGGSVPRLVALVGDRDEDASMRGYAAVALGLAGVPSAPAVRAVSAAVGERSSDELRRQAALGLALLTGGGAFDVLDRERRQAGTQAARAQVIQALGHVGDARAIPPLAAALEGTESTVVRSLAAAGLGLLADLEPSPSLARLSRDVDYRDVTPSIAEALGIL